jgi:hypothetical protein
MNVRFVAAACALLFASPAFAQGEWDQYKNLESRFTVSAPGQPTTETTKWKSEYDSLFPETIYRWKDGPNRYSVSVIDYSDSEAIYTANNHSSDFGAAAYWQIDILGSIQYAATQYRMKPGVKVIFDAFHYVNLITGHELQLINPDQSRTFVALYLHENRLYIFDATVAKGQPAPLIFNQSMEFLDAEGKSVRYRTYYFDKVPDPKLGRPRGAGADPGAPAGPGGGGAQVPGGGAQGPRGGGAAAPPAQ